MRMSTPDHVQESLRQYQRRDPELYLELQGKFATAAAADLRSHAARAIEGLTGRRGIGAPATTMAVVDRSLVETIVRPNARPVMVIQDNKVTLGFLGADSQVWAGRIGAAKAVLDRVIPAVGRVEVGNNADFDWVGTGWLVASDIIVTNRHVAREFGRAGSSGFTFRPGVNGGPMSSRIDFLEEDQRFGASEYAVSGILWIAPANQPDVAFLRVTRSGVQPALPTVIDLASAVGSDDFIATIGYPARDPRVPDQDLVLRIFGDVYDKKRLAPGQIMTVSGDELEHDCSTLGGNSGSALVSLRTGEAVGLHFSGLYMQANFAVPAPKLRDLLEQVKRNELPGVLPPNITPAPPAPPALSAAPAIQALGNGTYTLQLNIPIEITVKVGAPVLPGAAAALPAASSTTPGLATGVPADAYESALQMAREQLKANPDVLSVRLGYRFKRGWITDERVVVIEVKDKQSVSELRRNGKSLLPAQFGLVGVDVRTGSLRDQLEHVGIDLDVLEARPRPGAYHEPPDLSLDLVHERMKATFHVSPDSGFPNLKQFFGRVQHHLTATIYEWEKNHVSDALANAILGSGATLRMVTQKNGTAEAVADMQSRVGRLFSHVFASVGAGRLFPSAYHIKVASRDDTEFWLSSGNWKDSNQADIDPAGDHSTQITPLRQHNREWHAIVENAALATMFKAFIAFDFAEAQRVPLEEGVAIALPDVFVPEEVFTEGLERVAVRYFAPLQIDRDLEVQPLLTPDRDTRGRRMFMRHALQMMAKATTTLYVQNQSFNLLDDNVEEFEEFFKALVDKQRSGVDVRVIFRDSREFGSGNAAKQQQLLERIKDFGLDTDAVKLQRKCHTKGIIVDATEVMLGSHNLTNEGALFNRDASLLVRDPEVARYFQEIFLFDWETLATQEADELVGGLRIAAPGEATPPGFRRISLAEMLGES
jgi:hypothetical protein